jgi:hypothetical protein
MRGRFTSARSYPAAAFLILLAVTVACRSQAEDVRQAGTIGGFVKYASVTPSPTRLAITKDREVCGTAPLYDESLMVGRAHGVANAVVTIVDNADPRRLIPEAAVRFDQNGCRYVPHVAVFPAGSTVVILNSDGILHNIHTESTVNPVIDLAQPGFKKQIRVTIAKPEIIKVTCDAHNWMDGWWYVTSTPYYAISDRDGRYTIPGVPPGTHNVRVWQERLGTQSRQVVVKPGATTTVDFIFKPSENQRS